MTNTDDGKHKQAGFTLIELSIVLVIIGLLVGGIFVGRDLITAASVRAQISQIDKYQTAVKTFRLKYNDLPGDLANSEATQLGFVAALQLDGFTYADRDNNGFIESICSMDQATYMYGESSMFWNDLGVAQLIDGNFANDIDFDGAFDPLHPPPPPSLPPAQIGNGNYVYVWSGGYGLDQGPGIGGTGAVIDEADCGTPGIPHDGNNYFAVSQMPGGLSGNSYASGPGLSANQAFAIDTKMDDGLPQSGKVLAMYPNATPDGILWATGDITGWTSGPNIAAPTPVTPGSAITCFDNSATRSGTPGVSGAVQHYSTELNGGNAINCALSFTFQ